jgi:uncharacterized protein YdhG (YjbR/CyaY superfamily)
LETNKIIPINIDEYIAGFPKDIQEKLQAIRETIHQAAPGATERISYQMPTFFLYGNLVHFAAHKGHIGFYPAPSSIVRFEADLSGYPTSKGAIQFPFDKPIPHSLVKKIVIFRVQENTQKQTSRKKKEK